MTRVRIYQDSKAATQSGKRKTKKWVLEFIEEKMPPKDFLSRWPVSFDMNRQVFIFFDNKEQAIAFAEKKGLNWAVGSSIYVQSQPRSYADNFSYRSISAPLAQLD